jgi:AraC-like DNA-binding protein
MAALRIEVDDSLSRSNQWVRLAKECLYDERLVARRCTVSVRQLQRYFLDDFGRSPKAWLNEQRMVAARNLLFEGNPVKMVASQLGFKQPSHFCREFKRSYRMTPSEYLATKTGAAKRFTELER